MEKTLSLVMIPCSTLPLVQTRRSHFYKAANLKNLRHKQRSTKRADLPIAPAFAAGLPIAPAAIPLPALALPIATYCSGDPNTIRREGTA